MAVYDQVKRALQDVVAPELSAIRGEIRRLDEKIDSTKNELLAEIKRVDSRMGGLEREIRVSLEIRERLAAIEAKLGISHQ